MEKIIKDLTDFIETNSDKYFAHPGDRFINRNALLDHLEQLKSSLPQPVEVPEFVAHYIERCKRADSGLIWSIRPDRDANDNSAEVYDWLFPNGVRLPSGKFPDPFEPDNLVRPDKINQILFARAWLDGYTVVKEPLYYVKFPNVETNGYDSWLMKMGDGTFELADNNDFESMQFTEKQIKAIDERYWAFAVPVEVEK